MDTKTCTKCGEAKPRSEFYRRSHSKDGLSYTCKACSDAATRAWMAGNRSYWSQRMAERRRSQRVGQGAAQ